MIGSYFLEVGNWEGSIFTPADKTLPVPVSDTYTIYFSAISILNYIRLKNSARLLGVSISDLIKNYSQISLIEEDRLRERLLENIDGTNNFW